MPFPVYGTPAAVTSSGRKERCAGSSAEHEARATATATATHGPTTAETTDTRAIRLAVTSWRSSHSPHRVRPTSPAVYRARVLVRSTDLPTVGPACWGLSLTSPEIRITTMRRRTYKGGGTRVAASRAPSRIFVSHLAGQAVFDQDGDQVGRIRDVVVALRDSGERPRVLGLLVEVTGRRRVFLPMTRVNIVEDGRVVTTGLINMRRFQQRPGESLLLAELADRSVRLVSDGTPVHVIDVALEENESRDWDVTRLFVKRPGKGLRRRGETSVEDWEAVTGFVPEEGGAPTATALSVTFEKLRPADLARAVRELAPKRRAEMVATPDDERLADVLQELPEEDQAEILDRLGAERAADVLEAMEPDDAADLLGDLPTEHAERLLGLMEAHEAAPRSE